MLYSHEKVRTSEGQGISQGNHVLRKLVRLVVETNTMTGESGHNDHSSVESWLPHFISLHPASMALASVIVYTTLPVSEIQVPRSAGHNLLFIRTPMYS